MTLAFPKTSSRRREKAPGRLRCREHMAFVGSLPCCVCLGHESQVHHLTCGPEPKARGLKASDCWTLPCCRACHDALHARGDERAFWHALGIDPIAAASRLWLQTVDAGRAGKLAA